MRFFIGIADSIGETFAMIGAFEKRVLQCSFGAHIGRYPVREKVIHPIFHYEEVQNPRREDRQKSGHQYSDNGRKSFFLQRGVYHFFKM